MDTLKKPRMLRIVSGSPAEIEAQVNLMLEEYQPMTYNFAVVMDQVAITVLLVHKSVLRQMQILQPGGSMGVH